VQSSGARKHVGYLPENPAFYDFLSAREYLMFTGKSFGMSTGLLREKTEDVLSLLELREAGSRPMRGYSKGMVQRLGLAQALIHDPDIYVLDEPMSGLDPVGRALVKKIITELRGRGKCVFFSTHITADVETVCDRVGIIVDGALKCVEQVDSILTAGIVGYHVQLQNSGSQEQTEYEVSRDELPTFIAGLQASNRKISLVEPKRQNLEAFFLDIVKGRKSVSGETK
jgi:ABC-2 type transport system ATP-binding protein